MSQKIDKYIVRFSKPKYIIVIGIIFLLINLFLFPLLASDSVKPLDLGFFYNSDFVYDTLNAYNKTELSNYFLNESTVDIIYPIVYTSFLCLSLYSLFHNLNLAKLPFMIFIFDLFENLSILYMIHHLPARIDVLANITGVFSGIKWFFALINLLLLLYGLYLFIKRKKVKNED